MQNPNELRLFEVSGRVSSTLVRTPRAEVKATTEQLANEYAQIRHDKPEKFLVKGGEFSIFVAATDADEAERKTRKQFWGICYSMTPRTVSADGKSVIDSEPTARLQVMEIHPHADHKKRFNESTGRWEYISPPENMGRRIAESLKDDMEIVRSRLFFAGVKQAETLYGSRKKPGIQLAKFAMLRTYSEFAAGFLMQWEQIAKRKPTKKPKRKSKSAAACVSE